MANQYTAYSATFEKIYDSEPAPTNGEVAGIVRNGDLSLEISDGDIWYDIPNARVSTIVLYGATYFDDVAPADADEKDIWYDTNNLVTKVYHNGSFLLVV